VFRLSVAFIIKPLGHRLSLHYRSCHSGGITCHSGLRLLLVVLVRHHALLDNGSDRRTLEWRCDFACWLRGYEKRGLNLLCINTVGLGYSAAIGMGIGPRPI
jgi:hypothetical protein